MLPFLDGVDRDAPDLRGAACIGHADLFYPDTEDNYEEARKICGTCPVLEACLEWAMRNERPSYRHGMWGSLTPRERALLHKTSIAHGTPRGYRQHTRYRIPPCPPCADAERARWHTRKEEQRASV